MGALTIMAMRAAPEDGTTVPTSATDYTVSDVIALEIGPSPEALAAVVSRLTERLQAPENRELRRALTVSIRRVVLQRLVTGTAIPPVNERKETESMPAERVVEWSRTWKEQSIEEGRRLGLEQGRKEGEIIVLERLLTRRFGPLPEIFQMRLHAATTEQFEHWADQILEAGSLEEFFNE
jgi:flagellar biosynthesis/type III secretory pathway protein FliH